MISARFAGIGCSFPPERFGAALRGREELNAAVWRLCPGKHEQQRVWQLPAGPHPGVSPAGLRPQQDGEDRGAGRQERRENRYGFRMQLKNNN